MSVMGFHKSLDMARGEWVGGLYPVLFWIFGICLTLQNPYNIIELIWPSEKMYHASTKNMSLIYTNP